MAKNEIEKRHHQTFEEIKQVTEGTSECWSARDLQPVLEYSSWDKFKKVVEKAMTACEKAGQSVANHFSRVGKMVKLGSGAEREVEDFFLSRYACYLIVQNGDPSKPVIANGQTYFAIQTRRQELSDDAAFQRLKENEKRLFLRNELKEHNKQLVEAAQQAGVESDLDFAVFQNHGYKGLYGGLEKESEDSRPHGQHGTGGESVPRHSGRRKTAARRGERENQCEPHALRGRRKSPANH